ncbi:MAG: HNH endonuclease [Nitrosomonadaceae bacterium]
MYIWKKQNKKKKLVHILAPFGQSFCKCENGGIELDGSSEDIPSGYRECKVCSRLLNKASGIKKPNGEKLKNKNSVSGFYTSFSWARLRYQALRRNDGCCECCGRSKHEGAIMNVDHIKPIKKYPELKLELSNLQVLCGLCNWGKGSKYEEGWREPSLKKLMGEEI